MRYAIGHNQIIRSDRRVVAGDLIEHVLFDFHVGRLAFGHENGFSPSVVGDNVGAVLYTPIRKTRFDRGSACRKTQILNEVLYQVLTHPFLGRQSHMFPAKRIKNGPSFAAGANIEVVLTGKIQKLHKNGMQSTEPRR